MRVATFPENWRSNPFLDLMENALKVQGVEIVKVGSNYFNSRWLLHQRGQIDVLHFHWLEYHYRKPSLWLSWFALVKLGLKFSLARLLGYRIIWTMHNILPHERLFGKLDYIATLMVAQLANGVIVLCDEGRKQLRRVFLRRRNVFLGYHGHYISVYPNQITRFEARSRLGIDFERIVYLFFGSIRPYKGIETLIADFQKLEGSRPILFIVGQAIDQKFKAHIHELVKQDRRIHTKITWVDERDVQVYFNAADVVVLPFTNVLTTGSLLAALSFGKPVIAPSIGCIPEIMNEEIGIIYNPADNTALQEAMRRCLDIDLESMGQHAHDWVQRFTWEELAERTIQTYQA